MAENAVAHPGPATPLWKRCLAVGVGNFMEWFDFATFGFFAGVIGQEFFVGQSKAVAVLSALAVFAVGFLMRPLGGLLLGPIGDRYGRRTALTIAIIVMGLATTSIGCLPNYHAIGVLAPALLVLARCLQGLSAGGEYSGAAAFLLEAVPAQRRCLFASVITCTSGLATMTGSLTALGLTSWLSPADLAAYGWRIPFWCALPLSAAGLVIRLNMEETPVFRTVDARRVSTGAGSVKAARRNAVRPVLMTLSMAAVGTTGYYYLSSFVSNFLQNTVRMPAAQAFAIAGFGLFVYVATAPLAGHLADRFGRRPVHLTGVIGTVVATLPAFMLLRTGALPLCLLGVALYAACQACIIVTLAVMLVELFPASARMSGASLGYNIGQALFGGPSALIGSWLALTFASAVAPAFYVVGLALVAACILSVWLPETRRSDIASDGTAAAVASSIRQRTGAVGI